MHPTVQELADSVGVSRRLAESIAHFAVKSIGGVEGSIAIQAIGVVSTIIYASLAKNSS